MRHRVCSISAMEADATYTGIAGSKVVAGPVSRGLAWLLDSCGMELMRICAESTSSYGLPGQDYVGARYRGIVELFAVLN
jgi:hypothetical protein